LALIRQAFALGQASALNRRKLALSLDGRLS
jgi:hypothetical protein